MTSSKLSLILLIACSWCPTSSLAQGGDKTGNGEVHLLDFVEAGITKTASCQVTTRRTTRI